MAESKYSIRLAALDAYSATFGDFGKKSAKVQESIKAQQAELRKLNSQAKDMDGFAKLTDSIKKTESALQAARAEQARLGREQATASNRAAELATAYGKAVVATKALESSTAASAVDVAYARAEQKRLGTELDVVSAAAKKLGTQHDKASASARSLERAARRESDELKRLETSLTATGVDTAKLAGEQTRLKAATEAANNALGAQRTKLEGVQRAQGKIDANRAARGELRGQVAETMAVGYLASRPVNQAMNLETAMADVGKVINFEGNQRAEMAAANLTLASDRLIASSGMTAIDLAKIEYAAGQSGIGKEEKTTEGKQARVMEFTRDAAIMGSAFDIGAGVAGETMAGWKASMKLDRVQTLDLADSVNYLGNNFNAKAADIAAVVKRFGAVGSASGLTPEQTAALSTALLNPGTEKEIAGTGFKNFTSALVAGKSATKGEKKQWKELGFDPEDLAGDMQKNAPDTIMRVLKAIRDQPREEQAAIATTLFGSDSIGAIQPLLENLKPLEDAFAMVGDKSKYATSKIGDMGSMMQEAAGVANTSRTGLNAFTARLTRLSTVVGNAMLPALNAVLIPLGALVDGLSWAAQTFPGITGALAVAAAGLASLKVGALGLKFVGLLFGQALNKAGLARAKLDTTTARTAMSADAAVARLNGALNGLGGAGGPDADRKGRKRGRKGRVAAGRGGAALGSLEAAAGAAPKAGALAKLGSAGKVAGRAAVPLMVAAGAIDVVSGLSEGDSGKVGSGLGGVAGSLGGAWAGAGTGAAIGTMIMPGIGTAVGGAVGGLAGGIAGSEFGSWLGEKLGALVDRLGSPDKVSKDVAAATAAAADNRTFAPVIHINGQDQASAQALADMVMQKMHQQFTPMMMANPLAIRSGASLTDGGK